MKFFAALLTVCACLFFVAGCGESVDENKTPEQIKQEVMNMSAADIQKKIEAYTKAIESKTAELKAETEKLAKIPLAEQLGDEAKKVRANIGNIESSLSKLKDNMAAYAEGLNAKK